MVILRNDPLVLIVCIDEILEQFFAIYIWFSFPLTLPKQTKT